MRTSDAFLGTLRRAVRVGALLGMSALLAACPDSATSPGGSVTSVSVSAPSTSLRVLETLQLSGIAKNASNLPVTGTVLAWSSGDNAIATVSAKGLVTGHAVGTVTMTAADPKSGHTGTMTLTVTPAAVATVLLTPAVTTITAGTTTPINAVPRAANGQVLTGRACKWSTSDAAVLTVSSPGGDAATLTGVAAGTATVAATCEGKSGTAIVTVKLVPVAKIVITPDPAKVEVGKTLQLTASVRDAKDNVLTRVVSWSSGATGTATVDSKTGLVTGVSEGKAEITATADGFTARDTVTVGPKPVHKIVITPQSGEIYVGHDANFTATAYAADEEVLRRGFFAWSVTGDLTSLSSNMILSGPQRGAAQVFGVKGGSVRITATLEEKSATATLKVLVPTRLTLTTNGTGGGTLSADPHREVYAHHQVVRVTPNSDVFSYFANWGSSCSGTTIPCQVTMNEDRTVSGTFKAQPWMGTWGSSMTAKRTYSDGTCTWSVTFSPSSSVVVTYPRNSTTGVRTVNVVVRTRLTSPKGQATGNRSCSATDLPLTMDITGTTSPDGSFTVEKRNGPLVFTVQGSLTPARTVAGTVSIVYDPTTDQGSGSATAAFTAQPTLQAPPSPGSPETTVTQGSASLW